MVRSYDPSKLARNVRSEGTEDYYGSRDGASPLAPSHGKSPTAAPRRPRWSYPSYHAPLAASHGSELSLKLHPCIMRWMSMAQRDACHV